MIPLGSSSAGVLFPIVRNTISDIESCNCVEAMYTDNYPLNVSLFKLFSNDSKTLQPKVKHPCDPVHIIKSIRNNWLNLHDHDKTFVFPLFEESFGGYSNDMTPSNSLCVYIEIKNITVNHSKKLYPQVCTASFDDI